jgi:hypothetical protein
MRLPTIVSSVWILSTPEVRDLKEDISMKRALVLFAIILAGCGHDPHNLKITDANKDTYIKELAQTKGLTVEEIGLLSSFEMRRAASGMFGRGDALSPVGKTVGQLIDDERKLQTDAKAREQEQQRLAAEAKAKEDAQAAELRKAINLTVFDKSFHSADIQSGDFEDRINLKCAYENTSGKDIRAFKGAIRFTDLFGAEIYTVNLTISDPVAAGQKATWDGSIKYNQFMREHQALRNAELANMKVEWRPASIIYADGTTVGSQDK